MREDFSVIQKSEAASEERTEHEQLEQTDSLMAMLMNIQGLIRIAIESTKHKDTITSSEKGSHTGEDLLKNHSIQSVILKSVSLGSNMWFEAHKN